MAAKPRFDGEWVRLGELISKAPIERCGSREYPVYSMTMRDGIVEQAGRFKKTIASKDTSSYKVVKKILLFDGCNYRSLLFTNPLFRGLFHF